MHDVHRRHGAALRVRQILFAARRLRCPVPADDGYPPKFAALAGEYADVLADPPPGLPPDSGPAFDLRIETGTQPMPRSWPI